MSAPLLLASCNIGNSSSSTTLSSTTASSDETSSDSSTEGSSSEDEESSSESSSSNSSSSESDSSETSSSYVSEVSVAEDSITSTFSLVDSSNNEITPVSGVYTLSEADTYTASGQLSEGQIYIDAADLEVEIEFKGVSISNSSVSPIYVADADTVELKFKKGYDNYFYDNRTTDYSDSSSTDGKACIYADNGDLKITGKGNVYVHSYQNSGIHGKDNVKVKNVTLSIEADNNGIKGNDKITIEENPTIEIYAGNNGLVTSNSDLGSSAQHGYIYINGGEMLIHAAGDAIDAAYAIEFGTSTDSDNVTYSPVVNAYTNVYSDYGSTSSTKSVKYAGPWGGGSGQMGPGGGTAGDSSAEKSDTSAKGLKACEVINITAGDIYLATYDDAIHGNAESDNTKIVLDNGNYASGDVTISGGTLTLYASDDAVHADGDLVISGGTVNVTASHEGIEGNTINISGGTVVVTPVNYSSDSEGVSIITDDAINASSSLVISGGYVDAAVNPSGDYDCLDSNGSFSMTGGVVVARGPASQGGAGAIDCDGNITISGGTLLVFGNITSDGGSKSISTTSRSLSSMTSTGTHTFSVGGTSYTFENLYTYSSQACYSNSSVTVS